MSRNFGKHFIANRNRHRHQEPFTQIPILGMNWLGITNFTVDLRPSVIRLNSIVRSECFVRSFPESYTIHSGVEEEQNHSCQNFNLLLFNGIGRRMSEKAKRLAIARKFELCSLEVTIRIFNYLTARRREEINFRRSTPLL